MKEQMGRCERCGHVCNERYALCAACDPTGTSRKEPLIYPFGVGPKATA